MRLDPTGLAGRLLTWYGLLGAPFAWTLFHVVGVGIAMGVCSPVGARVDATLQPWSIVLTAAAVAVAFGALLAAGLVYLSTRGVEDDAAPPVGRIHFLAVIGLTITPLFIAIILMSGIGGTSLGCRQG
jgi:hypothetical protein